MNLDFSNINIFHNTPFRSLIELINNQINFYRFTLNDNICLEYKGKYGLLTLKNNTTGVERLIRFVVTEPNKCSIKILLIDIRQLEKDHLTRRKMIKELHDVYGYKPMFISTYLNINRSTVKRNLYDY